MANISKDPDSTLGQLFPDEQVLSAAQKLKVVRTHTVHINLNNDKSDYLRIEVNGVIVGTYLINANF